MGAGTRARAGTLSGLTFNAMQQLPRHACLGAVRKYHGPLPGGCRIIISRRGRVANVGHHGVRLVFSRLLGQMLADSGIRTAVIGNADVYDEFRRHGALIAVDAHGRIPFGNVGRKC